MKGSRPSWTAILVALAIAALAIVGIVLLVLAFNVSFKSPALLLLLLLIPVVVGAYLWVDGQRTKKASRWSSPHLLPNMVSGSSGALRYVPVAIFGIALVLLLVGFARPEAKFTEAKEGATVVLMVDTSGSMGANDVKPTRLRAADAALTEFMNRLPSKYRVALITFSSGIAVRVAPTYDHSTVIKALPVKAQLDGTAMGDALAEAVAVAKKAVGPSKPGAPHPPATILLVSDGGSNAGKTTPEQAATLAKKAAIPVSTVSLGTASGVVHQNVPLGKGTKTFPLVRQVPVDPSTLKSIAKTSGGTFFAAHSPTQLEAVYKALGSRLVYSKQYREITVGVTLAAFVLILLGAGLSAFWFRRLV
ncbi:MAG TPA: VWA domain-containing protein [Gaiellaceae bacterium]|nr:VWA domain-containing protein [Gaiellaceae bacterium]